MILSGAGDDIVGVEKREYECLRPSPMYMTYTEEGEISFVSGDYHARVEKRQSLCLPLLSVGDPSRQNWIVILSLPAGRQGSRSTKLNFPQDDKLCVLMMVYSSDWRRYKRCWNTVTMIRKKCFHKVLTCEDSSQRNCVIAGNRQPLPCTLAVIGKKDSYRPLIAGWYSGQKKENLYGNITTLDQDKSGKY